jgi:protein kinase C substrate 80K-H
VRSDLNTNTTLALPGFYCNNKGHIPAYISFTAVNDGICDYEVCCDGSDEYGNVGGVKCPDKCGELGAEYRKLEETRQKSTTNALKKKKDLIADASRLRQEITDQIRDLDTQIRASEAKVAQLEQEKIEIEKRESLKVTKKTAVGGKLGVLTGLAKQRLSELKDALTDVREQRQSYKERLAELESILSTFKTEYNPNFNDEGVKRAVRSWEDYSARDQLDFSDGEREASYEELVNGEDTIDWEEFETAEEVKENDLDTRE